MPALRREAAHRLRNFSSDTVGPRRAVIGSTGALYLWELTGLTNENPGGFSLTTFTSTNPTATLTYTQTQISSGWNQNATLATFQATDVNGDPGLITVDADTGQVQAYEWNGSTLTTS